MITWGELKSQIYAEDDLSEEVFASEKEIIGYANDAIRSIEKDIHAIGEERYFETYTDYPIVPNQRTYSLPQDIYARKIRQVQYINNNSKQSYEILPIRDHAEIAAYELGTNSVDGIYKYRMFNRPLQIVNDVVVGGGVTVDIYPLPLSDNGSIRIYYIRKVNKIVDDNSFIEIPESEEFLKSYIIEKCMNKERMIQNAGESAGVLEKRNHLVQALTSMLDDNNNEVIFSSAHYALHN